MFNFLFALILLISLSRGSFCDVFRIDLSTGKIEGESRTASYSPLENQTGIVFLGIPFAKPPIRELRFEKPVRPEKWMGVLETKKYSSACMSDLKRTFKSPPYGTVSEDCLYLNVFTNKFCLKTKNCSVMLVIHGGKVEFESASAFNPDILINNFVGNNRNIIVVTTNYRLGIFGFSNFGEEIKNLGMYDVLESINWIHREIRNFGGDPKKLTLAGHSAGGALIAVLILSPELPPNLVARQILMSSPLQEKTKRTNSKFSREIARILKCSDISCLKNIEASRLFEAQQEVEQNSSYFFDGIIMDGKIMEDYFDVTLSNGNSGISRIPTLLGTTTGELRISQFCQNSNGTVDQEKIKEVCWKFGATYRFENPQDFAQKCTERYGNFSMAQYFSDDLDTYAPTRKLAEFHSNSKSDVFLYSYKYSGAGEAFDKYMKNTPSPTHSEDLIYVFGTHRKSEKMNMKDYLIEKVYSGIFADFVNFKKPLENEKENWEIFEENNGARYFEIDFDENGKLIGNGMRNGYYQDAHQFWNEDVKKNFTRIHLESYPKSLDSHFTQNLMNILKYHHQKPAENVETKPREIWNELYEELDEFVKKLTGKTRRFFVADNEKFMSSENVEKEENGGGLGFFDIFFYFYLGVIGISILFIVFHQTWRYFWKNENGVRNRDGYTLLQ
ncbi:unnamed protein product [Caenorhabditis angaria]|uniref:Carboxylic ester hydrolase n=1 Tax=Caenorhabditis angaria TaxID=860376 RepID=A0A9P1N4H3_9PELO|nr:unnamed protein product [Caenorhabditis angaria]